MSAVIHARVVEQLTRLRLRYVAERLDAVLNDAARTEPTYLDFLDGVLRQDVEAKQRTRTTMGLEIAHFPTVKTLDDFDFKFQPSVDQRLVRELATACFLACSRRWKNSLEPLSLSISEAADEVVVHHADRLHVRIHDGRTDEAESALLEILAERVGFA
jgi:hypothetical protein